MDAGDASDVELGEGAQPDGAADADVSPHEE